MKKVILILLLAAPLGACQTAEEHARQVLGNIDRSCHENRDMGYANHADCVNAMVQLYASTQAQRRANTEAAGQALSNAGAALQSISPPPPPPPTMTTTQCQNLAGMIQCHSF